MQYEELKEELRKLEEHFLSLKKQKIRQYIDANNPYKKGDVVTDHIGSLKIESYKYNLSVFFGQKPCAVYYGIELKKDGTPMKKQSGRGVLQSNIKE